jgi:hypothetical protein
MYIETIKRLNSIGHLVTILEMKKRSMFYFQLLNFKSSTSFDLVKVLGFITLETNKLFLSSKYLSIIYNENEGCVTISDTKPAWDRLFSSMLIEI